MGEIVLALVFVIIVIAAVVKREQLRANDRRGVYCPSAKTTVEIRDGVCRDRASRRVVGVSMACERPCMTGRA